MADDVKLLAVIDANTKSFENALKRIERATNQTFTKADHSVKGLEASLRHSSGEIVALGRSFATAFGAGILVGGIVELPHILQEVVKSVGDIGTVARTIGIGTDELQKLRFAAEQSSVSTEALDKGLQTFAKNLGLAAHGGAKDFAEILKANGVALTDAAGKTKPVNEQFKIFADLVARAKNPQDALAIATIAFGRGLGQELLPALQGGAAGLDLFGNRLEALNGVIKDDTITKAEELTKRFNELRVTVSTFAQSAAVDLADFANEIIRSGEETRKWIDELRAANQDAAAGLDQADVRGKIEAQKAAIAEAEVTLKEFKQLAADGLIPAERVDIATSAIQVMKQALVELEGQMNAVIAAGVAGVNSARLTAESAANAVIDANEKARRAAQGDFKPGQEAKIGAGTVVPQLVTPPGGRGGGRSTAVSDIERQKKAVVELIAELQRELGLVGASDTEQHISNALRRAGAVATEEQKAQIVALVTQIEAEEAAQERLIDTLDGIRNASGSALDAFAQSIQDGEGAAAGLKAALVDVLQTIIRIGEQQAISSLFGAPGGAGGGIFGNIIGGLFGATTGGGGPALGSLTAASASVTGGGRGAPVIQLNVVPGQMFEPVVEMISGNVSIRHAASAETRAVARTPASARDNQRRFAIP